jgi:hypothetical protein
MNVHFDEGPLRLHHKNRISSNTIFFTETCFILTIFTKIKIETLGVEQTLQQSWLQLMADKEKKRALRLDLRINSLGFSESGKRQRLPRLHCCMETLSSTIASFFKQRPKIPIYETNPQICCSTFISPQGRGSKTFLR